MTDIQANALSDAELDAVVGGAMMPKALQAVAINHVEHQHIPKALMALFIHEIVTGQEGWRTL